MFLCPQRVNICIGRDCREEKEQMQSDRSVYELFNVCFVVPAKIFISNNLIS